MDPITLTILALAAIAVVAVVVWTWEIFGTLIQIVAVFAAIGLVIGLIDNPQHTLDVIYGGIASFVDFAHHVRDIVTKP